MRYGLTQTVPPAAEPLALADLKTYLRVDGDDTTQDGVLLGLIADVRARFERQSGKQLVLATWLLTQDWFWDVGITYIPGGPIVTGYIRNDEWRAWQERGGWGPLGLGMIRLPRSPLAGVTSVQYVDAASGSTLTVPSNQYQVDKTREPGDSRQVSDFHGLQLAQLWTR